MLRETYDRYLRGLVRRARHFGKTRFCLLGAAALTAVLALSVFSFMNFVRSPFGNGSNVRVLDFPPGSTTKSIAADLERSRIISNGFMFSLYARIQGADARVKAGTYRFSDAMPPSEILRKLVAGEVYEIRFSVPEGYSIYQIAELLDRRGIFRKESFLRACFSRPLLDELGIRSQSVEGHLYPSTYTIRRGAVEADLVREMAHRFQEAYHVRFAEKADRAGLTQLKVLTLASMIEKEAVVPEERPLIASVFFNRLKLGMPLQSDPTAIYGMRAFGGGISKDDILRDTPYNTYRIKGLPPGPIGNPGDAAIEAVLSPARTKYLYFVARKDGTHHFSETLEEHNLAVQRYLRTPETGNSSNPAPMTRAGKPNAASGK